MAKKSDKLQAHSHSDKLMIEVVRAVENMDAGGGGGATEATLESINNKLIPVARTSSFVNVPISTSASTPAGARSVSFFNSSNGMNTCTVAGGTLNAGRSITFSAGGEEDILAPIAYATTGTSTLDITIIV